MKRQKITDRNEFDAWDKLELSEKSNNRCAHCGKKLVPGVNATVDHFIPLAKGGINQRINITMLCEDCNRKKADKIINPIHYLPYLDKKHFDDLYNYFNSYIHSFEFIERRNILACDEYSIKLYTGPNLRQIINKKTREKMKQKINTIYTLTRATKEDKEEITQFFIRYLKKYNQLHSEDTATRNIDFWMTFGCIYYIRNENNKNIELIVPITFRQTKNQKPEMVCDIFAYYVTHITSYLTTIIPDFIAEQIVTEQNIPYINILAGVPKYDKTCKYILWDKSIISHGWLITNVIATADPKKINDEDSISKMNEFYKAFKNIVPEVDEYLARPENNYISYMKEYISDDYNNEEEAQDS